MQDSRFLTAILLALCAAAAGCHNRTAGADPFLQRRLVPEAPMGAYTAPPPGAAYYQSPAGQPAMAPAWSPPLGANRILPASADGGGGSGWVAAEPDRQRRASTDTEGAASLASANTEEPAAATDEPGRIAVSDDAREVPIEGSEEPIARSDDAEASLAGGVRQASAASARSANAGELRWTAPAR